MVKASKDTDEETTAKEKRMSVPSFMGIDFEKKKIHVNSSLFKHL